VRVLVIGAGAIGCLLGGRLASTGHDVTLVGRSWLVDAVQNYGLDIAVESRDDLHTHIRSIQATESVAAAYDLNPTYDLALLTTKAHDVELPSSNLAQVAKSRPVLVTLQNGVGAEEIVADKIGVDHVMAGTISIPVSMTGPAVIETVERGGIGLAPMTEHLSVTPIAEALRQSGFQVKAYNDYRSMKWSKLLLNIIGNATSAILGWPPERVYAHEGIFTVERQAFAEALQVMRGLGLSPVALPGYPLPTLLPWIERLPSFVLRPLVQRAVRTGRGGKMPSMYIDLVAGRRRLEVDVLNGAVARYGEQIGLSTPVNKALTLILQQLASGEIPREQYCDHPQAILDAVR